MNFDNMTLREVENLSGFIIQNADPVKINYVSGSSKYLFKISKSIEYFTHKAKIKISFDNPKNSSEIVFQIGNSKKTESAIANPTSQYAIINYRVFGRFGIIKMLKNF